MAETKRKVWRTPPWVPGHIAKYLEDPAAAHLWDSTEAGGPGPVPSLLLTTTGRKSGRPQHSPLIYKEIRGGYVVIASKGGWPDHPAWYLNLVANPECEVRANTLHFRARARTATGAERAALWAEMREVYPPYDAYQARTEREIPVVVLSPES